MEDHNSMSLAYLAATAKKQPYMNPKTGNVMNRPPKIPTAEELIVVCHCKQMRCISSKGEGSCFECKLSGGAAGVDDDGTCRCAICKCQCNKAYKVSTRYSSSHFVIFIDTNIFIHSYFSRSTKYSRWE
jgi:hypothetical protein